MQASSWIRIILAIVGSILFLDGAILIALKKIHIGTVLPFLIGLFFCIYAYFYYHFERFNYLTDNNQKPQSIQPVKAIIVLGTGIENGQPSATLAKRLDRAAPLAKVQPDAKVIVSGGIDFGEKDSEAIIMSRYLQQKHQIPATQILLEDKSTSTELNLKNSQPLLSAHHITLQQPIAIVTSDFHTLRAQAIAKKQGYTQTILLGSTTPLSTRYNAWLREYFAYASGWILNEY